MLPGLGKTVTATAIIYYILNDIKRMRKSKTMIIVDRDFLMD